MRADHPHEIWPIGHFLIFFATEGATRSITLGTADAGSPPRGRRDRPRDQRNFSRSTVAASLSFSPGGRLLSQSRTPQPPAVSDRMEEGRSEAAGFFFSDERTELPTLRKPGPPDLPPRCGNPPRGREGPGPPVRHANRRRSWDEGERRNTTRLADRRGRAKSNRPVAGGRF